MTGSVPAANERAAVAAYGIRLPNSGPFATAEGVLAIADAAVELGYEHVWVHDHISWGRDKLTHFAAGSIEACQGQDPNFFESIATIAYLAGRYPGLAVGIAGLVLPLRDPRVVAKQLATLDQLAGGRAMVAAAIGNIPEDFETVGVPYKRRGRITNEYLQALCAILRDPDPVSYEGEFVQFSSGTFLPKPVGLRVWLTGSSEAGLTRAAQYGDGWLTVYQPVGGFRELSSRLSELAAAAGRDPDALERGHETYVSVAETEREALESARASLLHSFKGDLDRALAACMVGTPAQVAERMAEYRAAGAVHFELKFYCRSLEHMREQLGLLAEHVLTPTSPAGAR